MAKRKGLSKKIRFDVFKRDAFVCQYCGNHPPTVVLEVDHIIPIATGGSNDIDNLVTSCFDCNRGKSCRELSTMPQTTIEKTQQIKEKEEQYIEYKKLLQTIDDRISKEIDSIDKIYSFYFDEFCHSDRFKFGSLRNFISELGYPEVERAMRIACNKIYDSNKAIKYFCGICWNRIREVKNG